MDTTATLYAAPAATAPVLLPSVIDAVRPGDTVRLTRYWPARVLGPAEPAARMVRTCSVTRLVRLDTPGPGQVTVRGPQWWLETAEPGGGWALGVDPNGMTTVIEPA